CSICNGPTMKRLFGSTRQENRSPLKMNCLPCGRRKRSGKNGNHMRKSYLIIGAIWLLVLGGSCQSKNDEPFITQGYDLGNPEKIFMPDILLEVSGISFYPGNDDSIWAV